ncbi:hypothetical protein SK128_025492, partial [Halocaridina rubra]
IQGLEQAVTNLTKQLESLQASKTTAPAPVPKKAEPKDMEPEDDDDDDEEIDLFGSDSEEVRPF